MSTNLPRAYDLAPFVAVPGAQTDDCAAGWDAIGRRISTALGSRARPRSVVTVDCYPGVDGAEIERALVQALAPVAIIRAEAGLQNESEIDRLIAPFLGGTDPIFGRLCDLELNALFDPVRLAALRKRVEATQTGLILVIGCGAGLIAAGDLTVYADLARWEIQLRQRRGEVGNLGATNRALSPSLKYKRAFFVDWRICDRWKRPLIQTCDFFLDTTRPNQPLLAAGAEVRRGLQAAVGRPFRVVPFFDPAPWGGQWLKAKFPLDSSAANYGWGFDCVPEENSLLLGFGDLRLELPAMDLVLLQPLALLGDRVFDRFGAEFPIRFDFLDTMGGGNLSLQVHPLADYIRSHFGLSYTQEESYYILDAGSDAGVYLGWRNGTDPAQAMAELRAAQAGGPPFEAERFVNRFPARAHDHFLIPAGTVHCSGANVVVLEISATPYIFTFKLWDWARLGLDGQPRPINLERGAANLDWSRDTDWTKQELVNAVTVLGEGKGWREERTGLHATEFIETRRHWFSVPVDHDTGGNLHVLNLVSGTGVVVESPTGAFAPFPVSYAETFIVPAAVGTYRIRPRTPGERCATMKAFVRAT